MNKHKLLRIKDFVISSTPAYKPFYKHKALYCEREGSKNRNVVFNKTWLFKPFCSNCMQNKSLYRDISKTIFSRLCKANAFAHGRTFVRAYFCKAKVSSFARTKQSFVRARLCKVNAYTKNTSRKGVRFAPTKPNLFWYSTYNTSYTIARPLVAFLRRTITTNCVSIRLPVYPDLSNSKMRYSRNRIRKQLVPTIKFLLNPKMEKALFQFSEFYNN